MKYKITELLRPLKERMQSFAGISFVWLLAILVVTTAEFVANKQNLSAGGGAMSVLLLKMGNGLEFWGKGYVLLFLLYLAGSFYSLRLGARLSITVMQLLILLQVLLVVYFSRSLVPLGADLYGYSLTEIGQTAGASGGIAFIQVVLLLGLLVLTGWLFHLTTRRSYIPGWLAILLPIVSLLLLVKPAANRGQTKRYASEFDANLVPDKANYFISQSLDHFFPVVNETDIYSESYAAEGDVGSDTLSFKYPDEARFPFFHADNTRDVLSPFFGRPDSMRTKRPLPNIVIILVEGLGRAFTNEGAYLGNFTPFIDSLARCSLYWKNFLSEGGRTFAVLPSLLGSLPFGQNGFLEMGEGMPQQLSLINILRANGYHTSFYYGGDAHFDNMDIFLKKNGIETLNDGKTFPAGYTKLPANGGFSWGYNDGAVYRRNLDTRPETGRSPELSILLTVSTHSPFAINEEGRYARLFEQRMAQTGMDEPTKTQRRVFKDQFASILYADETLREFFSAYSKRADYLNTIFIITGDHRMPEIPMRSKIDRYHVPLLIFSPLLKRTAEFESLSTHFDLTPSLLAFLGSSYGLQKPAGACWMGSGLDTARQFRNIHAYPLMQTKTDLLDFVAGEYHLNGTDLFRLSADLNEDPIPDDQRKRGLEESFARFQHRNQQVITGAKLFPDSSLLFLRK